MEEKISTQLSIAELKKQNLRRTVEKLHDQASSVLTFMVQWKDLEDRFDSARKFLEEREREIEEKRKKLEDKERDIEVKEMKFDQKIKAFEAKEREFEAKVEDFELKLKLFEGRSKKMATLLIVNSSNITMDGRELQMLLNECFKEHDDLLRNEVSFVLNRSTDSAKLVLDAMEGFYPPHLRNGDVEFEEGVVRRSCVFLLEELMRMRIDVGECVKKEAKRVGFDWIAKMRVDVEHYLEVLGFLLLLGCYGLASAFDADVVLSCLNVVAKMGRVAPELLRAVGFADDICIGFIQTLIKREQRLEAVKYVWAFEMVDKFPLASLLKDHLSYSKEDAERLYMEENNSIHVQIAAMAKERAAFRDVITCIVDYKLESEFSLKILEERYQELEGKIGEKKHQIGLKLMGECSDSKCDALASDTVSSSASIDRASSDTISETQQLEQSGNKRRRVVVSSNEPPRAFNHGNSFLHSKKHPRPWPAGRCMNGGPPWRLRL